MPDDPNQNNSDGQTGVTPPVDGTPSDGSNGDADQPSYVTQEQLSNTLEEKLKSATDSMFAMVRKMQADAAPQPPATPAPPPKPGDDIAAVQAELAEMKAQQQFDRSVPQDTPNRALLEKLYMHERPDDVASWLKAQGSDAPPSTTPNPAPGHLAPKGAPPAGETASDILKWTKEDYAREYEAKAPEPQNPYDIRNKPFYSEIRKKAQARLKDVKILLPRRGQE